MIEFNYNIYNVSFLVPINDIIKLSIFLFILTTDTK